MEKREDRLNPEEIDTLTERSGRQLPEEERRLIQDFYRLSENYRLENERSLDRIWIRLAQTQKPSLSLLENRQNEAGGKLLSMKGKSMETKDVSGEFAAALRTSQGAKQPGKGSRRNWRRRPGLDVAIAAALAIVLGWALLYAGSHAGTQIPATGGGSTKVGTGPQGTTGVIAQNGPRAPFCSFQDPNASIQANIEHTLSWSRRGEITTTSWNVDTYNVQTCRQVPALTNQQPTFAYWSPDGTHLLILWSQAQILDKTGQVLVTHTVTPGSVARVSTGYVPLVSLSGSGNANEASAWSPDGTRIASVYVTGTTYGVEIWSATTGAHQITLDCPANEYYGIRSIAWSPDGKYLTASAPQGSGICVWNASTGSRIVTIPGTTASESVAFSADSKELAFVRDSNIVIYNLASRHVMRTFAVADPYGSLSEVAWSPDGEYLAVGGQDLHVLKASTGSSIATYKSLARGTLIENLAWSADSTDVASQSADQQDAISTAFVNLWHVGD